MTADDGHNDPGAAEPPLTVQPRGRRPRRRTLVILIILGVALLVGAAWISFATVDLDTGVDLSALARLTGGDIRRLRWQFALLVVGLAALHYLASAIAARTAAGGRFPIGEMLLVQLAASAANRVTPAGLGGSALTVRYFTKKGMSAPTAVGAVAALLVLGGLADLLALVAVVLLGSSLGLHGSTHEIALLTRHVTDLLGPDRSPWLWIVVVVLLVAVGAILVARSERLRRWRQIVLPTWRLLQQPRGLFTLLVAAGSTTLILGFAFIATTAMVPGPRPVVGLGGLLVAFMLGSAAGSAVPIPAGLGSSEAAFVAILTSFQVPTAHAIEEVLLFRIITFWAPALVGVVATRYLLRRRVL